MNSVPSVANPVPNGTLLPASPPSHGGRSVRSLPESGSESIPATEITEITEAQVLSHLKATQVKWRLSRQWQKEESLCELCPLWLIPSPKARSYRGRIQAIVADQSVHCLNRCSEIVIEIGIGRHGTMPSEHRSNLAAKVFSTATIRLSEKVAAFSTCPPHSHPESSRRGRRGVFDPAMGVGRSNAVVQTIF